MEVNMKGILGRKLEMTQVFSETGRSIPVTVIEIQENTVTQVLTKEKHGYEATQLAVFDRRDATSTKPLLGHFKKANIGAKRFVREIRNMNGFNLGDKINGSIFQAGELVDVEGTSKGHGFQGNIKRHGQHIGPKSHGGGGGSQPIRQVGSLGDMVSNRVFKGMTMPGHMGVDKTTVQNLEVIAFDAKNNALLVKGSIPGPKNGFVIITDAVKGLPKKEATKLANVQESILKNHLLEEAKVAGASINTEMSVEEMKAAIAAALAAKEAEQKAAEAKAEAEKLHAEEEKVKAAAEAAHKAAEEAKAAGDVEAAKEAEAKAEALEHQVEVLEEKEKAADEEARKAEAAAEAAEETAKALQVEDEQEVEEETKKEGDK